MPLVLDLSVQFVGVDGEPVILEPGNYLVAVRETPPLELVIEAGAQSASLEAVVAAHEEKIDEAIALSVAGEEGADEHHLVLLLPSGKVIDAHGSYTGVQKRAGLSVSTTAISNARTVASVGVATSPTLLAQPAGSPLAVSASVLKPRSPEEKSAKFTYDPGLFRDRLVVKFREGAPVRTVETRAGTEKPTLALATAQIDAGKRALLQRENLTEAKVQTDLTKVNEILRRPSVKVWQRLFTRSETFLRSEQVAAEKASGVEQADLGNYYVVLLESGQQGENLVDEFNALASVEIAYLAPIPEPADIAPPTQNFQGSQGYLNAAPQGIDAVFAWTFPGGRGAGMRVVDVEQGWNLPHEEFRNAFLVNGNLKTGDSREHGTAVLGEMVARNDGTGVTGIASDASHGVVSAARPRQFLFISWEEYSVAEAINVAAGSLSRGDVILIEQHAKGPSTGGACTCPCAQNQCNCGQFEYVAMENWQAEFDAIKAATAKGIIVVEAAGNGSMNLDAARYGNRFNRSVRDSGAIIVGASNAARAPTCWTNFGSRVDVHAWGQNVFSSGYGRNRQNQVLPAGIRANGTDSRQWYRPDFGGTSSASPIVAGSVLVLNGIQRAAGQEGLSPAAMRTLLRNTGTPQTGANQQIGPLPNLRAAIGQMDLEDCIGLNPNQVSVQRLQDQWRVVAGSQWLLAYGNDQAAANQARDVIRHYGMNKTCYIGRPDASLTYWLVGDAAPSGAKSGEDCVPINPAQVEAKNVSGRWKLVQGSNWIDDFGSKENEARAAVTVIKRYNFTRQCFVKRPSAKMTYWRH